jgi:hypothetical protein
LAFSAAIFTPFFFRHYFAAAISLMLLPRCLFTLLFSLIDYDFPPPPLMPPYFRDYFRHAAARAGDARA